MSFPQFSARKKAFCEIFFWCRYKIKFDFLVQFWILPKVIFIAKEKVSTNKLFIARSFKLKRFQFSRFIWSLTYFASTFCFEHRKDFMNKYAQNQCSKRKSEKFHSQTKVYKNKLIFLCLLFHPRVLEKIFGVQNKRFSREFKYKNLKSSCSRMNRKW